MQLSIITICYNEAANIERTLQSVVNQTWQYFEWIVVDGGSTDGTLDILEKYKNRINILITKNDNGIYNAMNKGIRLAKGEYIYFLNGGDYFYDNTTLDKIFSQTLTGDLIYGNIMVFDNNIDSHLLKMPANITLEFLYHKTLPHQSTLTRKDVFEKIGLYDESLKIAADYDFTIKALTGFNCKIQYLDITFAWYLPNGVSHNDANRNAEKEIVHRQYFNYIKRFIYRNKLVSKYFILKNHIGNYLLNRKK